jgi:hypothetical protein
MLTNIVADSANQSHPWYAWNHGIRGIMGVGGAGEWIPVCVV